MPIYMTAQYQVHPSLSPCTPRDTTDTTNNKAEKIKAYLRLFIKSIVGTFKDFRLISLIPLLFCHHISS